MKTRSHDPLHLDVMALAGEGAALAGEWPADQLPRLLGSQAPPQDALLAGVRWQVRGERRPVSGGEPELWLHLQAGARVWLTCQRCLQPFEESLEVQARVRFVRDEAQAEALDAELEEDVLALPRWLDLRSLVEDELLLALPLVPRHAQCPQPLTLTSDGAGPQEADLAERPNPFAVLQALKGAKPPKLR